MPSTLHPEFVKGGEASDLACKTPVKKVSVQAQLPAKFFNERLATPLRCRRSSGRPHDYTEETEVSVSTPSAGKCQKPWPSRKVAGVEELVKYMASVPSYLQRVEKGENVQEKALNVGVIDWRRLERWTNTQKTDQKNMNSSTINMEETPSLLRNQSCSYSGRDSSNSSAKRKQTSCRNSGNSPADKLRSRSTSHPSKSKTSPVSRSLLTCHEKFRESKHEYVASLRVEAGCPIEEDKSQSYDERSFNHDERFPDEKQECVLDHHQDISGERSKSSSTMHGDLNATEMCNGLSGKHPEKSPPKSSVPRDILQSGLLSSMFHTDKSNMSATALQTKNGVTSTKLMTKKEEGHHINKPPGNYMVNIGEKSSNQKVEDISGGRIEPFPKHPSASSLKWLNRSSSLKDIPSSHQLKDSNGLDISDDKGRSTSRSRRSPLRRILDPLLKSKYDGNSGPIACSPISAENSTSTNTMPRSSDASIGSSSAQMPITSQGLLQDERYGVPMRQALVKLAWKNGQPLFMFSTNDSSVLVASMRRTNRLGMEDAGGVYTIVAAQESKKKGSIWIGQSRNRKPNLLYDVVGRIEVSCSKLSSYDSENLEVSKQFVLVSDELVPSQGCVDAVHRSQLAAIVVKVPYQKLNGYIYNALTREREYENIEQDKYNSFHTNSLPVEKYPDYSRACGIAAILPSGIHGVSELGKPSTLIERWKSGGSCDCGGWDEGCRLTVLADSIHEMNTASSVQEYPTTNVPGRIELFVQGGKAGRKYSFSMIAYKEGLYTIEFGSSISSLQAFAICIATLHSRNSIDAWDYSVKQKSLEDSLYENYPKIDSMQNYGDPTSYERHHPPFSPVSRS